MTQPPVPLQPPADLLHGRVILVTGAGGGIGSAVAQACARHGATVALHGRRLEPLERVYDAITAAGGPEPALLPLDLASATERDFEHAATVLERQLGRLDGIAHLACAFTELAALEHQHLDPWLELLRVNVAAVAALNRAFTPMLRAAPDAAVVLTLEDHGADPGPFWGPYGISKHALGGLLGVQAREWDAPGAPRINAVVPGPVDAPLRARTHPGEARAERRPVAGLVPAYLYLLGPHSRGTTGTTFVA